ncbi:hypothetical protein BH11CYA1_BH11CYA1_18080 [soil metagenome]
MGIPKYVEDLQAKGRYAFSYPALVAASGKTEKAVERALSRLRQHGAIANPRKGFYVIVPPEYRVAGCLPPTWFIDDMLKFMDEHYYVGLLSAAELFGAAHHRPQEFQVVTERSHRLIECGRTRIRFFSKRNLKKTPTIKQKTRTGVMQVSTPEATALDLVRYSFELGGLSSVAIVIGELAENLKSRELINAAKEFESSVVQRLGFALDRLEKRQLADPLSKWLLDQQPRLISIRSDRSAENSKIDERWRVKVNEEIDLEPCSHNHQLTNGEPLHPGAPIFRSSRIS